MPGTTSTILATAAGGALLGPLGAVGGYAWAKSQAHRKADWFVPNLQNPFGNDIKNIIAPITEKLKAGTATYEEVQAAQDAFEKRVSEYNDAAFEFSLKGGDYEKVYKQAQATLDPQIESHRKTLTAGIDALKPGANGPEAPPTMQSVTPGRTPAEQSALAAEQQRKRSIGGGRQSTILGGTLNQPGLALKRPQLTKPSGFAMKRPTIVGY